VCQVEQPTEQPEVLAPVDGGDDEQLAAQVGDEDQDREQDQQPGARPAGRRRGGCGPVVCGVLGLLAQRGLLVLAVVSGRSSRGGR
jgi:hypothetical protein